MQCPRGWLLAKNDAGFDVPFFVKVRGCDIFYPVGASSKFIEAGVLGSDDTNITVIPPGQTYALKKAGWDCTLNNDESFSMGGNLKINEESASLADDLSKIMIRVDFPWKVKTNENIDINIYKECKANDLILSQINIVKDTPSNKKDITGMVMEIYKFDGSTFAEDCLTDPDYNDSIFHITVNGTAQLGEYSHSDDGNNVGMSWENTTSGIGAKDVYTKSQVNNMIETLRKQILNGELVNPSSIMDLVNEPVDSKVFSNGFILDIDEDAPASTTDSGITEEQEVEQMTSNDNVMQIDLASLGNFKLE